MPPEITFEVDDVAPFAAPLPSFSRPFAERFGAPALVASHDALPLVDDGTLNPLAAAVHLAFSTHRPLVLSPDEVWITLAHGFARHVDLHAEALRGRFVRHAARRTLRATGAAGVGSRAAWEVALEGFEEGLAAELGAGVARLFTRPFSTTGPVERAVTRVVLMAAFRRYFDYEARCVCGIPRVTLLGTADDWRDLRARVDVMAEYDLEWWAAALRPVCDRLVETAEGRPDRGFWRSIYKPREVDGGEVITGWLVRLFPYLEQDDGTPYRNDLAPATETTGPASDGAGEWFHAGVVPARLPCALSRVEVRVADAGEGEVVELRAGLVGVEELGDGALRARAAWAVCRGAEASFWARFAAQHETSGPAGAGAAPAAKPLALGPTLEEFYDRFGGARLYDGALVLAPRAALEAEALESWTRSDRFWRRVTLGRLADGGAVVLLARAEVVRGPSGRDEPAAGVSFREPAPAEGATTVVARFEARPDGPSVTVIAWSVREFFQKLVDAEALYLQ